MLLALLNADSGKRDPVGSAIADREYGSNGIAPRDGWLAVERSDPQNHDTNRHLPQADGFSVGLHRLVIG